MAQGLAVVSGSTVVHKLLNNGLVSLSGSVQLTGSVEPDSDNSRVIGSNLKRFKDIYAVQTTVGAIFEYGLQTPGIERLDTGTVVCWHNGELHPCEASYDNLVMGVVQRGKSEPIILGAENILVTGKVQEGDFLVTSDKVGHAMAANMQNMSVFIFGAIIGQALESCEGETNLIKCMISKR